MWGIFYQESLAEPILDMTWISDYIQIYLWDVITHPRFK